MGFTRTRENFVCEHCGTAVQGSGYTNHCPRCLWSKHVDISPGDRAETCGGMMRPVRVEGTSPSYILIQRCERCAVERRIRPDGSDDPAALVAVASAHSASR